MVMDGQNNEIGYTLCRGVVKMGDEMTEDL